MHRVFRFATALAAVSAAGAPAAAEYKVYYNPSDRPQPRNLRKGSEPRAYHGPKTRGFVGLKIKAKADAKRARKAAHRADNRLTPLASALKPRSI